MQADYLTRGVVDHSPADKIDDPDHRMAIKRLMKQLRRRRLTSGDFLNAMEARDRDAISREEFGRGICALELRPRPTDYEIELLYDFFDADHGGEVSYDEIVHQIEVHHLAARGSSRPVSMARSRPTTSSRAAESVMLAREEARREAHGEGIAGTDRKRLIRREPKANAESFRERRRRKRQGLPGGGKRSEYLKN
jgi:hypothetical protein